MPAQLWAEIVKTELKFCEDTMNPMAANEAGKRAANG